MTLRIGIYLGLSLLGGFGAVVYLRRAVQLGIYKRDFNFKGFLSDSADLERNSGMNLFLYGLFAAFASVGLLLKAIGVW
jgi:hypothetical protein